MDTSRWLSDRPGRGRRRARATAALVERMERRDLMTVSVQQFSATAGQSFADRVAIFNTASLQGSLADFHATIFWDQVGDTSPGTIVPDPSLPGEFDVLGSFTYRRPGTPTVSVIVTGLNNSTDAGSAIETVKDAQLTVIGLNITSKPGATFSGAVAQFFSANPFASATDFVASINWGDGSTTTGVVPTANPLGGFTVSGSHSYATAGNFTTTITVQDKAGVTPFSGTGTAAVVAPGTVLTPIGQLVLTPAGQPLTLATVGSFTDTNLGSHPSDFQAVITWGDGNTSAGTVVVNPAKSTGTAIWYDVKGSNTYALVGKYSPTIAVQDTTGDATTITSTAVALGPQISAAGTIVTATAGHLFSGTVATFTDSMPEDPGLSALINWGDGHTSVGTITSVGGELAVVGANTYATAGVDTVTVIISDSVNQKATATGTAVVQPSPVLTPVPVPVSAVAGVPIPPGKLVGLFLDTDTSTSAAIFQAVIDWGDGHKTLGTVSLDKARSTPAVNVFDVFAGGEQIYATAGSFTATITVQDNANNAVTIKSPVTVTGSAIVAVGTTITPTVGQPFSGTVATFTDPILADNAGNLVAIITWGDGHKTTGTVSGSTAAGYQVAGSNTYLKAGGFPITVAIADPFGQSTKAASQAVVVAPAGLTPVPIPIAATVGQPVPVGLVVGAFYDSDTSSRATDFQAVIAWGDDHTTTGIVTLDPTRTGGGANGFIVTVPPGGQDTYASAGSFTATITVQDNANHTATIKSPVIVTAPLITAIGTTIFPFYGVPFSGVVATFVDQNKFDKGQLAASINWGDGHTTLGQVIALDDGNYEVSGTNTYTNTGQFAIGVTIIAPGGRSVPATSTAVVVTPSPTFTGALVQTPGTGLPGNTVDTNTDRPTFGGTAAPFANIQLFGRLDGFDAAIPLGQTVAGPAGQWTMTVGPLLDGFYTITATVTPPAGFPVAGLPLANGGALVVDTTPPVISSVLLQRNSNQVVVTFNDGLSGLDLASVLNRANYAFVGPKGAMITPVAVAIRSVGVLPNDPVSVVLTTSLNPRLRGRLTVLRVINSGITDLAGNQLLAGSFHGVFAPLVKASRPAGRRR